MGQEANSFVCRRPSSPCSDRQQTLVAGLRAPGMAPGQATPGPLGAPRIPCTVPLWDLERSSPRKIDTRPLLLHVLTQISESQEALTSLLYFPFLYAALTAP